MFSRNASFSPPSSRVEKRIDTMIAKLSLEEKIDLLGGKPPGEGTKGNAAAGIPAFRMADGPVGVHWFTKASTTYPALIAAAASWNPDLVYRMGWAIGRDARARGIHMLLAPGVNIYRSALCGRNFEYCGEDPYLAAQTAVAYVRGVQDMGVAATVKHYAANYQEFDRHGVSSDVDERTLHEIYLPAFKAAVTEAGCGCVMTAYNLVNGIHCSEHDYLVNQVLKGEWGFDGLVMSDWVSTYSAEGAASGGLDLEMPVAKWMNREKLLPAVRQGKVAEAVIDDKIRRLLRLAICFGWLDHPQELASLPMDDAETSRVALDVAREGIVLLKNDGVLPLDRSSINRVAVVGANADPAVISGGGSAYNPPNHTVSILEGIRAFVGDRVEIVHASGPTVSRERHAFESCALRTERGDIGLVGEYFNNPELTGEAALRRTDEHVHFHWGSHAPHSAVTAKHFSVRWTGYIEPPRDGSYMFYANAVDGGYRVWLDGHCIIDTWESCVSGTHTTEIHLSGGTPLPLRIEYHMNRHWAAMSFGWESRDDITRERDEALALVDDADAVIVCTGFDQRTETEGADRGFGLQPDVDRFVGDVAKRNANTVVVLLAGGNVDMRSWIDEVRGLVHAWYPGQEGGTAVAEVLFGAVNPSGKLPASFEEKLEDRSSYECYHDHDGDKRVSLDDGIFCGYRHHDRSGVAPRFPFGFGLSYTTFEYRNLKLSARRIRANSVLTVQFELVNTGEREGAEVAQLYVSDPESALPRPVKELKGFTKVRLLPGESRVVSLTVDAAALSYYDPAKHGWTVEPGKFEVMVGASAGDIRLRAGFEVVAARRGAPKKKAASGAVSARTSGAKKTTGKAAKKAAAKTVKKSVKKAAKKSGPKRASRKKPA